jgi:hypothetical protein
MNQAFSAKRQASRKNGLPVAVAERADAAQVLERDRLAAARVVGDGHHHERHAVAVLVERPLERLEVDVALERVHERRVAALGDHEVERLGALDLDVGARGVEVVVVRHHLARPQHRVEEDALGARPWWVGMTCRSR